MKCLVVGGARSGKSQYAETRTKSLAEENGASLIYLATATAGDEEMKIRISHHQERRGCEWLTIEEPIELNTVLAEFNDPKYVILIDCMTLWLSNCLERKCFQKQRDMFISALEKTQSNVVIVSNEVGSGIVPMGNLTREFVDQSGWLNQSLAALCDEVSLVVAGLSLQLK